MKGDGALVRDSTPALVLEGYRFLPKRSARHAGDVFETRLLGERAICMRGPDAARLFYDSERFERAGAAPKRMRKTVLGSGGVHGLDGAAHRVRKQAFMRLMTPERIDELVALTEREWVTAMQSWTRQERVVLLDESRVVLCRAICAWAGVPLPGPDARRRAGDLAAMVDAFGAAGIRHWRGKVARRRSEAWIETLVDAVRDGHLAPPPGCALDVFARFRDLDGRELDRRVAAVEILNVLRPTLAVSYFVVFMAMALHRYPEWMERIRTRGDADVELFVQEVRRFFPFTPFLGARVRSDFEWRNHRFDRGTLVVLDVYGAHRDSRVFAAADRFDPDRFRSWDDSGYELIPQGGGDHDRDHRCAGEWITIAVMRAVCRLLTTAMTYEVPEQDLTLDLRRIPPRPKNGWTINDVRVRATPGSPGRGGIMTASDGSTTGPEPRLLGVYLNDHLAGATAGVRLARRVARTYEDSAVGPTLSDLAAQIAEDRQTLKGLMAELGVPVRHYKLVAARAGELGGRLKLNGGLLARSPLSAVVELEMLRLGIEGKVSGWRTLRALGEHTGRPDPGRMDALVSSAREQATTVESLRVRAAAAMLGLPREGSSEDGFASGDAEHGA